MDCYEAIKEELQRTCPGLTLLEQEPMWRHTTFEIGGPVRMMAVPASEQELQLVLRAVHRAGIVPFILGNGSNLLCQDEPIDRFIIKTGGALTRLTLLPGHVLLCGAGVSMIQAANFAQQNGLSGLEFASGIPGTMGGGIMMNAGAYGGEIKDILLESRYLTFDRKLGAKKGEELEMGYRVSCFTGQPMLITSGLLQLEPADKREIYLRMHELSMRRMSKQPLDFPSAGSTFKRPAKGYAAALIDRCGLKGMTVGGAQVSPKHAGFIVNTGDATCADVLELAARVQKAVRMGTGVELELEIKRLP